MIKTHITSLLTGRPMLKWVKSKSSLPKGSTCIFSLFTYFSVCFTAFAQPPIPDGDCSRNTLFFNSDTHVTTTISELSETTQGSGTWEAWVKKENWAYNNVDEKLFANDYDYPSETAFYISLHGAVGLHFRTGNTNGSYISTTSTFSFLANSWHHLAATWSESGGTVTTTIYIDGVNAGSITSTSTFDLGSTFYLAGKTGSYKLANGEMVEVRVWNVARTEQEIADNRNSILDGDETGLVAYYPLDEAAESTTATNMVSGGSSGVVGYLESDSWRSYPLNTQSTLGAAPSGATYNYGTLLLLSSKNETFTISNVSSSTIDLLGDFPITLSGVDADQFSLDLTGTAASLAAGASTTFDLEFEPSTIGEKNAMVTFSNVASCSDPYTINVIGTATDATLTYSGSGFTESTSNDGSVTGSISITLSGDTFQDIDADNLLDVDSEVTLSNIPTGLIPVLTLNSTTEAVLTLSGNASNHLNLNDVNDIAFAFDNSAFVTNNATAVLNATGPASSGLGINFFDATPSITYASTSFSEITTNNGTLDGSLAIILDGDTFQDMDADGLLDVGSEVTLTNIPDGLTPKITLLNNSLAAETWTSTTVPDNSSSGWGAITYGNGLFVAVTSWSGINGVITSPDGFNWGLSYAPRTGGFEGIAYGNGRFVAVGSNVISSADGITWTDTSIDDFSRYDVAFGNGLFVVVTYSDITHQVLTSPDGINWTERTSSEQSRWKGVSYGNGTFVAVADGGTNRAMYSSDGINWTSSATSLIATRITFGNGVFVATGTSSYTSTDGITWTQGNALAGSRTPEGLTYGKGQFVAVSESGISRSRDGINWTVNNTIKDLAGVAYGNGMFVGTKDTYSSNENNFFRVSGAIANLSFTGEANDHQAAHDVAEIQFTFDNTAFTSTIASAVQNATGPADSGVGIQFTDNTGAITFSGAGFTEVAANDGSVAGSIDFTLTGDAFQDTDTDNVLDVDTEYTIEGIPAGLTPAIALNSPTEATLTFTGKATEHQATQNLADVKVTFSNLAFTNADASAIANATGPASTGLGITFTDNTAMITYGGDGFREAELNDGSVVGFITFTLTGESFVDVGSNGLLEVGTELTFINLPAGLSPLVTLNNANTATLTLTGNSTLHQLDNTLSDVTITFNDAAFSGTQAAAVANATSPANTGRSILFEDNPVISFTGTGFSEAELNDGSLSGSISISLTGEAFNDPNANNELEINTEVSLPNLPAGLVPQISITENNPAASVWTEASTTNASWEAISYGNGVFVAIAEYGVDRKVMTSSDGESWSEVKALAYECNWTDITYGNGLFVVVGYGCTNSIMTSPDGTNWTIRTAPDGYWSAVTHGGGQFVAVASSGDNQVITSPDGVIWTTQTPASTRSWDMITYGNGLFVAIDNIFTSGEKIMTSSDGITWTLRDTGGGKSIRAVTFGNDLFVAVTSSTVSGASTPDRVITSPDGITWTPRTATEANYWRSVTYGNGLFVAVASSGTNRVMTSPDGINWTAAAAAADNTWNDIAYGNGRFVAVSSDGTNRAMISKTSAEATLTLAGNAYDHQTSNNVSGITFEFSEAAFVNSLAPNVFNATGPANSSLGISFDDNPQISWIGGVEGLETDWNTVANWSTAEVPSIESSVIVPASTHYPLIESDIEVATLEVQSSALLTVNSNSLMVNGSLMNNGSIVVKSGASLVTLGSVSGSDYQVERITTFNETTGRYSIVGSPIQTAHFSDLGSSALVYAYDESELYNPSGNLGANRFKTPTQLELLGMTPGNGYFSAFTGDENGTVAFFGTPNFGNVDVALSYTNHSNISGDANEEDFEGFNLVSNPYPAAISATSFFNGNSSVDMDASIYIWDDFGSDTQRGTNADYIVVNEFGNTSTNSRADGEERFDGNIRSVQGFFVKANSANQTLQFTDAMKVSGNNSDGGFFRKSEAQKYKLAIKNGADQKAIIVGFAEHATLGKDKAYDAQSISGGDLQLYSLQVESHSKLAIQGVPSTYFGGIPIGFSTATSGIHTIEILNKGESKNSVWLLDKVTGIVTDLSSLSYSFASNAGEHTDRFTLSQTSGILGLEKSTPTIYAVEKVLHFQTDKSEQTNYQLYNLQGARLLEITINDSLKVNLATLPDGVYLVFDGKKTHKIILD